MQPPAGLPFSLRGPGWVPRPRAHAGTQGEWATPSEAVPRCSTAAAAPRTERLRSSFPAALHISQPRPVARCLSDCRSASTGVHSSSDDCVSVRPRCLPCQALHIAAFHSVATHPLSRDPKRATHNFALARVLKIDSAGVPPLLPPLPTPVIPQSVTSSRRGYAMTF